MASKQDWLGQYYNVPGPGPSCKHCKIWAGAGHLKFARLDGPGPDRAGLVIIKVDWDRARAGHLAKVALLTWPGPGHLTTLARWAGAGYVATFASWARAGPPCNVCKIGGARAGPVLQNLQIDWVRAGSSCNCCMIGWTRAGAGHLEFARLAGSRPGSSCNGCQRTSP